MIGQELKGAMHGQLRKRLKFNLCAVQVHGAADKLLPMTGNSIEFVLGRLKLNEHGRDVFLPLARLGILSRLAAWAEEHCQEPAEVSRTMPGLCCKPIR